MRADRAVRLCGLTTAIYFLNTRVVGNSMKEAAAEDPQSARLHKVQTSSASVLDTLLPAFPYHNNARLYMQNASKTVVCDVIMRQRWGVGVGVGVS
jgi:hypothetical protein